MSDILLFAIVGLGAGAAYAILALGVVLIYRGSGVLNFAQGAIGMFATYCFLSLVEAGLPRYVALVITLLGAAAGGAAIYAGIMRPLRNAPVLARVVTTLGILIALQGLAGLIWGTTGRLVPSLFPTHSVQLYGDVQFGVDRFYLLGTAIAVAALLALIFRYTTFGLATRAASENEKGAALLGFSPGLIAGANWALGSALAALAGILIAPIAGLDTATLTLLILPALAAALVGRFSSFAITAAVGIAIGSAQSLLTLYTTAHGVNEAFPFAVVILAMAATGKLIPPRGTLTEGRPPLAAPGTLLWAPITFGLVAYILLLVGLDNTYKAGLATSMITAIIALSLVVVTGYLGQISLAQMTFAGVGGFAVSMLASDLGVPFPLSILLAGLVAAPIGVLLGLPALRVRGINLAVVTLGAAVAVNALIFTNDRWTGGFGGRAVPTPEIAGFSLDSHLHPVRFGLFALLALVLVALSISNLRRSRTGRRMLAVRGNERAAAAAGINVAAVKLQAFALSSAIAAVGGAMLGYQLTNVAFGLFTPMESITLVTVAYIGGIASVTGGIIAGLAASGGFFFVLLSKVGSIQEYYMVISGVLLIVTVMLQPDGAALLMQRHWRELLAKLSAWRARPKLASAPPVVESRERV